MKAKSKIISLAVAMICAGGAGTAAAQVSGDVVKIAVSKLSRWRLPILAVRYLERKLNW